MDTVKKEMEKSYGSSKDSITRYELYQSLGDDQLPEYTYKKSRSACRLVRREPEKMRFLPIRAPNTKTRPGEAYQPGLTADNWESYTEQASMQPPMRIRRRSISNV